MPLSRSHHEKLQQDLSEGLTAALRKDKTLDVDQAMKEVTKNMLANNPFVPPKGCPINDLPNELLAHIFYLGTYSGEEGEDDEEEEEEYVDALDLVDGWDDDDEGESEYAGKGGNADDAIDVDEIKEADAASVASSGTPELGSEYEAELPFQVLVSHVCKHWREVAIESPALWTIVTFTEPPFERSKVWIERSKGLPLDIEIDCTRPQESPDEEEQEDTSAVESPYFSKDDLSMILDIVIPHVERWRTLEVMVSVYEYVHTVMDRLAPLPAAPLLEVLQLYHYADEESDPFAEFEPVHLKDSFILFSGVAPKLTHVALWGVHLAWEDSPFLSGLKDLELAYHAVNVRPPWEAFAKILRDSPELNSLSLCSSGPAGLPTDWPTDDIIEMPSLRDFVLCYHEPEYIGPLMQLISVPNVHSLALDFDSNDYSSFARQLARPAVGRNQSMLAGLEHFKISGLPCDQKSIDMVLGQLSNLKTFNLNCSGEVEEFFDKLMKPIPSSSSASASSAPSSMYCPSLHTITTTGIAGMKMKAFVEARRAAKLPVTKVLMSEEDEVDEKQEKWLRDHLESLEFFEPSDSEEDDDIDMEDLEEEDDELI